MIIRPIERSESARFAAFSDDESQNVTLARRLEDAIHDGTTRREWCLVAESRGDWTGRILLRGPPAGEYVFVDFFGLDWDSAGSDQAAAGLIAAARNAVPIALGRELLYALDDPHPWHSRPTLRRAAFVAGGFRIVREARRWRWRASSAPPVASDRLRFRTLADVGEQAYIAAIAAVSEGTLDARLREHRDRLGVERDATNHFRLLMDLRHQPEWLILGYDPDDDLVGLFAGADLGEFAVVAYIGVVPAKRGRGYVDDLLNHGTLCLDPQQRVIMADTDVANVPMANAFQRAGYVSELGRTEMVAPAR